MDICIDGRNKPTLETIISIGPIVECLLHHLDWYHLWSIRFLSRTIYTIIINLQSFNRKKPIVVINHMKHYWLNDYNLLQHFSINENYRHIREIYLDYCWNISNTILVEILMKFGHQIYRLSLGNIYSIEDCVICTIGQFCSKICWLNLDHCWRVTDYGIRYVYLFFYYFSFVSLLSYNLKC